MTIHRKSLITAVLAVLPAATAGASWANPLLSGYGGPGQGSQAILGSALLGAGGGGGASSAGGGSSSSGIPNPEASSGPASRAQSTTSPQRSSRISPQTAPRPRAKTADGNASGGAYSGYAASARGGAGHPFLGLSGDDVLYIAVALGVLAFAGALTRRLAEREAASGHG